MSPRRKHLHDVEPAEVEPDLHRGAHHLGVAQTVQARLDAPTREQLAVYMETNHMSTSQAVRVLLALALRGEGESPEATFRAAAFREGLTLGVAAISKRVQESIKVAFSEMEGY